MPALQVKDFPEDLYDELKECAAEECRSVSQQTLYVLREYLRYWRAHGSVRSAFWAAPLVGDLGAPEEYAERVARADKRKRLKACMEELGPADIPEDFPDAAELIRQMREDRTDQILAAVGDLGKIREGEARRDRA